MTTELTLATNHSAGSAQYIRVSLLILTSNLSHSWPITTMPLIVPTRIHSGGMLLYPTRLQHRTKLQTCWCRYLSFPRTRDACRAQHLRRLFKPSALRITESTRLMFCILDGCIKKRESSAQQPCRSQDNSCSDLENGLCGADILGLSALRSTSFGKNTMVRSLLIASFVFLSVPHCMGSITLAGNVTALSHTNQLNPSVVVADFDDVNFGGRNEVPPNFYNANCGMTLHGEFTPFSTILPGIVSTGAAVTPAASPIALYSDNFPSPILGGGSASGNIAIFGLVGTFSQPVYQIGATISRNGAFAPPASGTMYITAWDATGQLVGQVGYYPDDANTSASFVGLDSGMTPIAMYSIGNDNIFAGESFDVTGQATELDNFVCAIPEPTSFLFLGLLATLVQGWSWAKKRRRVAG